MSAIRKIIYIFFFAFFLVGFNEGKKDELNSEQEYIFYFAYGSNMSSKRLNDRINIEDIIGATKLNHYELRFNSISIDNSAKCNIVEKDLSVVWGVLYKIAASELPKLDAFEGAPNSYKQKTVFVISPSGTEYKALTYVAVKTADNPPLPYSWYHNHVYKGAVEHSLPKEYIEKYIRSVSTQEDPHEGRDYRERLIYEY